VGPFLHLRTAVGSSCRNNNKPKRVNKKAQRQRGRAGMVWSGLAWNNSNNNNNNNNNNNDNNDKS
jgi:hypothetical protein